MKSISQEAQYKNEENNPNMPLPEDIGIGHLKGNGDFRSAECIELLKRSDIVVTNPPFSLFREYVTQLIKYDKKFLIIGSMNAITYKEIFKLIKENKLWLGFHNTQKLFQVPDDDERYTKIEEGKKFISMGNTGWFTNLDIKKRHEDLILYESYKGNEKEYPKYDNYDAINIDKTKNIPENYAGVMGVPISFLDKYNPEQFEILGLIAGNIQGLAGIPSSIGKDGPYINGKLKVWSSTNQK